MKNFMKIVHCSDLHEDFEALAVAADFAQAKNADKIIISGDLNLRGYTQQDLESLICDKNKPRFRQSVVDKTTNIYNQFKAILDKSGIQYLVVPGNYDTTSIESVFKSHNLDRKTINENGIKYFGYGGGEQTPAHIANLEDLFSEKPLVVVFDGKELYQKLHAEKPEIIITHQPPQGLLDYTVFQQHWGTSATTQYLKDCQKTNVAMPKLILIGHVHESGPYANNAKGFNGIAKFGETIVINAGNLGRFDLIDPKTMSSITDRVLLRGRSPSAVSDKEKILDWGTFAEIDAEENGTVKSVAFYSIMSSDKKSTTAAKEIAKYKLQ